MTDIQSASNGVLLALLEAQLMAESAFLAAAAAMDVPTFADQNGVMQEGPGGAAITNVRIRDGRRRNIPADYLYPVMDQPNLTVLTGAHVTRLTLDRATVNGVEIEWQGETRTIQASKEVILSAGAIQTPKILILSGICDRAELSRFGIASACHLPGVPSMRTCVPTASRICVWPTAPSCRRSRPGIRTPPAS
jgi:choline dehydrogenase-like flavoprotein